MAFWRHNKQFFIYHFIWLKHSHSENSFKFITPNDYLICKRNASIVFWSQMIKKKYVYDFISCLSTESKIVSSFSIEMQNHFVKCVVCLFFSLVRLFLFLSWGDLMGAKKGRMQIFNGNAHKWYEISHCFGMLLYVIWKWKLVGVATASTRKTSCIYWLVMRRITYIFTFNSNIFAYKHTPKHETG